MRMYHKKHPILLLNKKLLTESKKHGLGDGGNIIMGMNMAQALNPNASQKQESSSISFDQQIEALKKLKDLVDAGILSEDEFNTKKKRDYGIINIIVFSLIDMEG